MLLFTPFSEDYEESLEAIVTDTKVSFDDVIGLDRVKDTLREFILLPIKFPQLFQGKYFLCDCFRILFIITSFYSR